MQQTHYQILGVAPDATSGEIRKRFRELARQHHPDVSPDKTGSHQAFVRIAEAYRVLNDATRRADYDLTLRDRARRLAERGGAANNGAGGGRARGGTAGPRPGPNPPPNVGRRPGAPSPGNPFQDPSGGYRSGAAQMRTGEPRAASREPRAASAASRPPDAAQYVRAAQAAYVSLRYRDAIRLCKTALQLDSRNGLACGLLGDIYRAQGRLDDAIHYYTLAVQLSPPSQNRAMMSKLEDLLSREPAPRSSPAARGATAASRSGDGTEARATTFEAPALELRRRANRRVAMSAFGFALALVVLFALAEVPSEPLTNLAMISTWTAPMIWAMILGGAIVGATLALTATIRPLDEELFFSSLTPGRVVGPPVGLVLLLTGALFFYLSVGVYLLVGALQESFSRSVLRVFAATFMLTCGLAALVAPEAGRQVLLLAGNVVFISMLLGWMLGDFFRPLGSA